MCICHIIYICICICFVPYPLLKSVNQDFYGFSCVFVPLLQHKPPGAWLRESGPKFDDNILPNQSSLLTSTKNLYFLSGIYELWDQP